MQGARVEEADDVASQHVVVALAGGHCHKAENESANDTTGVGGVDVQLTIVSLKRMSKTYTHKKTVKKLLKDNEKK